MADSRTFGTMVTRIKREIRREGITADIKDAIVDAILFYEDERFYFNESSAVAVMSAGDPYLSSVPGNILEIDSVWMDLSGSSRVHLSGPVLHAEIEAVDDGQTTGQPDEWAQYKNTVRFYPIADTARTAHFKGKVALTEITASASSGATNAWMTDAEQMIRAKAKSNIYAHRIKNVESAAVMEAAAGASRKRLAAKTVDKVSTGKISKTRF